MSGRRIAGMRAVLLAFLLLAPVVPAMAGRNHLQPSDFEPLTSLPWKQSGTTLEGVLEAIYREPNPGIRQEVLGEYLRTIPVAQLGKAFDLCLNLEETTQPDALVGFFLRVWAERDPRGCWKRTQQLFGVIGPDWLGYDSWKERERLTVPDLAAFRASRFYLEKSESLLGFAEGVDKSTLPKKERVRLMRGFADKWFTAFGTWPQYRYPRSGDPSEQMVTNEFQPVFEMETARLRDYAAHVYGTHQKLAFEIAVRRWLQAEPAAAPEIVKRAHEVKWPSGQVVPISAGPSNELFMIWAKADLPGMIRWAEPLVVSQDEVALEAKGFLMSRVDAATRERWLAGAKPKVEDDRDDRVNLLLRWAHWDPQAALEAVVGMTFGERDGDEGYEVADNAAEGPWWVVSNTQRHGLDVLKDFDASRLPEKYRKEGHFGNWETIMETWGMVDIGEAARYGVDFLLRYDYAPREKLIRFFSGEDVYPDTGDMIDRTFCALRVWAAFKPKEMKAWIGTLKDAEMRKALTWLMKHPWGGAKE